MSVHKLIVIRTLIWQNKPSSRFMQVKLLAGHFRFSGLGIGIRNKQTALIKNVETTNSDVTNQ